MSKASGLKELMFKIAPEKLDKLIGVIKDLSGIDDTALFKINSRNILIYSMVGEGNSINAFKSYIFETVDIFNHNEFEIEINYIAKNIKSFARNLATLKSLTGDEEISCRIQFELLGDKYYCSNITFKNIKLKLEFHGGDPLSINTTISIDKIKDTVDIDNAEFSFNLKAEDFVSIKRLSTPDVENDVYYMNTYLKDQQNVVSLGESTWNLLLDNIDYDNQRTLSFPKKYFKTIVISEESAKIYVFDSFLMVSNKNSDFLISTEMGYN
jgi:hypothetical protein